MTATSRLRLRLSEPVDGASLATYRAIFGALMLVATLRFFAHGWIAEYYEEPAHFFTYDGFSWVKPWPAPGMYVHFAAMGVLATLVMLGIRPRASAAGFGVLFAYAHLIDKTNYLNHYFLVIWLCLLLACLPRAAFSSTVPRWALYAMRAQVGVVYVFGGIAKLKYDWLVDAQPMKIWLAANSDFPVIGPLFEQPFLAYAFSWAGALFDLSIVPLLLYRRTRLAAYGLVVLFHLTTARLFHLGMFPWIMLASSLLFLPPDWPRRWLRRPATPTASPARAAPRWLGVFLALQVLVPLRHLLYPGDVCWTEQGFRFSWHVMVMEKNGSVVYRVREPSTGRRWEVVPTEYVTRYQARMASAQPDMILQLAHIIADDFRARGVVEPEVRADAFVSLNGRRRARLVDPDTDLARESSSLLPAPWILPRPAR
ncbi:MAG: HTTM domain-containing protein [Deltaproteobacteria bacterium]|nr:HTTM domain-containing protein [Deltaproteobacteria bacterium]MCW5802474.1 HTTM domain-containing protein [Deltaproteobacteria bacterium]